MNILPFLQNNNSFAVVITRAARSSVLLILSPSAVPDKTNIKLIGLLAMRSDRSEHWHYYICLHQDAFINICQATNKNDNLQKIMHMGVQHVYCMMHHGQNRWKKKNT